MGSMTLLGAGKPPAAGGAAAAWSPNATAIINNELTISTTTTFNLTLTTAATDTVIVFLSQNLRNNSGVTIGGDAMTQAVVTSGANDKVSIWYRIGAYTNPAVVATSAASGYGFVGCSYGKWTGASAVPDATTAVLDFGFRADPSVLASLTVPSGGVLLAVAYGAINTGITWDNITKDTDLASGASFEHSSAHHGATIAVSQSGTAFAGNALAAITIGP